MNDYLVTVPLEAVPHTLVRISKAANDVRDDRTAYLDTVDFDYLVLHIIDGHMHLKNTPYAPTIQQSLFSLGRAVRRAASGGHPGRPLLPLKAILFQ